MDRIDTSKSDVMISAAGMRIVRLLVGRPPTSVASLIRAAGVTRTAVTEQLNELVAAGFVERKTERLPGRGRPRHLYSTTNHALLLLFANAQSKLVPAMWEAVADAGGNELVQQVLRHVSRVLAQQYKQQVRGKTPQHRLKEMARLLVAEGNVVEVDRGESGQLRLQRRSCPYFSMFEERTKAVCCIDRAVITEVVGAPVERTTCRYEAAPCCTFELAPPEPASANGK